MMNCRARCVLMLEYYITDVSAKFDGLALVSVPETGDESEALSARGPRSAGSDRAL